MQKLSQERYAERPFNRMSQTNNRAANYDIYGDLANLKGAISHATHNVKDRAGEILSNSLSTIRNTSSELRDNVTDYIHDKPLRSIGIAAIAGLLLGAWLKK